MFFNAPPYDGPTTDHFDGRRFHNSDEAVGHASGLDLLKWTMNRDAGPWERREQPPGPPPPRRVESGIRVTLVGHATLLVQMKGLNFLTDPVWADRIGPVSWAGPKRFRQPALRFEDLPPIDLVLVSHNHYDHLCVPTLKRLAAEHNAPPIVTGLGNLALLAQHGIPGGIELDWWDRTEAAGVSVTGVEMQHFSGRGPGDRDVSLWMGLVVHHEDGDVLFCGDTGYGEHFTRIRERVGAPRLALVPIGAFRPRWFMSRVHVDPHQAVQAHLDLGAQVSIGMHYGTFRLADDGMDEPIDELAHARDALGVKEDEFRVIEHGVGCDLAGPAE
ncbi:MAG: MBL fold metallo-hydrolase [Myxococcota bacterium]